MKPAIAYIRVSTHEQAISGLSIEAQRMRLEAYATLTGLDIAEVVIDAGVSASKPLDARPGGGRLVALVRAGAVSHVAALRLDRLFRDTADCLEMTRRWDAERCALHLVDLDGQAVDTSTAMGRFFLTVTAAFAELERNLIAERTAAALEAKRRRGEITGTIPFGQRLAADGVHLERCPKEDAIIARVLALRAKGESLRAIAERLDDEGWPSRGTRWHKTSVARILKRHG